MPNLRRVLFGLLCLAGVLGLAGAGGAWWYSTTRPEYRLRRGQEALRQGNADEAERLAVRLEADGYPDHAHLLRGEVFLRQLRIAQTVNEINQIREENEAIRIQGGIIFGLGFLSLQRPVEAERLLLYVVSKQPDNRDAHRGLAALYFDQGARELALRHIREWSRLAPEDSYPYRFLGIIYTDFGDSNAWAIDAFREALRRHTLRPQLSDEIVGETKQELAELLVKQTEYVQALQVLDDFDSGRARSQRAVELRGECLRGLAQAAPLLALLDQGLKDFPSSGNLLRLRAMLHLEADETKAAVALLEQALQIDRHDNASRYQLAQAYESLGQREKAVEQRRLMQQSQDALDAMSKLSAEAMSKPWDAALRYRLVEICEKLDKHQEAAMWRKAAAVCPPAPEAARPDSQPSNHAGPK
jgi:tetratricopeptide (TPR) repeat protein